MPLPIIQFPTSGIENPFTSAFNKGLMIPSDLIRQQLANKISGVQAQYAEPNALQNLVSQQLANRLREVQAQYAEPTAQEELKKLQQYNQYYSPNMQSEMALRNAQTQHYGELNKNLEAGQQPGVSNEFNKLPKPSQKAYIDQIIAMGYSYPEAIKHAYSGTDFGDLAQAKGFDRDLQDVPKAESELTGATRTQLARSNMAKAGLDAADEFINKGIANYAGQPKALGTPIGFYKDSMLGINKDKQSDFIASTVLAQDQAFLRARQAGAPLSQGLLHHTLETSLTNTKASMPFTSPEVFKEASMKIKKAFDDINAAENKVAKKRTNVSKSSKKPIAEMTEQEIENEIGGR